MSKILITGGSGFIGFHLARYLSSLNNEITIVDNLSRGKFDDEFKKLIQSKNVNFQNIDLTIKEQFNNLDTDFDYAYHLAAVNGTKYFYEIPEQLLKINILSILNFLEWVSKTNCKNILFSSSSETYASTISYFNEKIPTPEEIPLCIDNIFNPRSSYAVSKIAGESLVVNYARKFKLRAKIVRFHNIYGPRMGFEHVIPEFCVRIIKKENPFKIFGGNQTRAFCYIDDAIESARLVMEKSNDSIEIFHIGNDKEEILIENLAQKLFDIVNFHPTILLESEPEGSVSRRCPNIDKIRRAFNFEPKIMLDEGLTQTFDWYKKNF